MSGIFDAAWSLMKYERDDRDLRDEYRIDPKYPIQMGMEQTIRDLTGEPTPSGYLLGRYNEMSQEEKDKMTQEDLDNFVQDVMDEYIFNNPTRPPFGANFDSMKYASEDRFDAAWALFKARQSKLGEYDPDFISDFGPVTEYHGTMDMQRVLDEGIRGGSPKRRSKRYVPADMRNEDRISYTTDDKDLALLFAMERARQLGLPMRNVGVVGVRAEGLPRALRHREPMGGILGGTESNVRSGGIPRSRLAPIPSSTERRRRSY